MRRLMSHITSDLHMSMILNLLSLMLGSTNNFKNETDLRLQLCNLPTNPRLIAFCYTIESQIL